MEHPVYIVAVELKQIISKKSKIEIFTVRQVFEENFHMRTHIYRRNKKLARKLQVYCACKDGLI